MENEQTPAEQRIQLTFHADREPTLSWQIGEVRVTRVVEGISEFPRGFLPALTDDRIDACMPWAEPYVLVDKSRLLLSTHTFVVETPEHVVVVDTCVGPHDERPMGNDPSFLDRLGGALPDGLDSVDIVVCTHLHFDHVGWNTRLDQGRLVPTFAHARYLITDTELRATRADDHMGVMAPSVQPLLDADVVDAVRPDHRIDGHVRLQPSPGHSAGHVCVAIESGGAQALITGDAVHSPMQFAYPDATAEIADADSSMAIATRVRLVADLTDTAALVLGTHFPTPTAGHVRSSGSTVWFDTADPD